MRLGTAASCTIPSPVPGCRIPATPSAAADQPNYTIAFEPTGTFSAKADCNQLSGSYTTTGSNGLTIVPGPMTLAACPPESLSRH